MSDVKVDRAWAIGRNVLAAQPEQALPGVRDAYNEIVEQMQLHGREPGLVQLVIYAKQKEE